jgi:uncharacterized membrane protein YhhN
LRTFDRFDAALLLLSLVSGAAYMVSRGIALGGTAVVVKALRIAPLAVLAFRVLDHLGARRSRSILTTALMLSCVGDVLLVIDPRRYFLHALWAFLLAHLAYIALFAGRWPRPLRPTSRQMVLTAVVLVYSLLVTSWLAPSLGRLTVPAIIYAGTITAMTVSAILAGLSRPFVCVGAILFMISDSLLAAARFKTGWLPAAYLVWPLYYLGQYGIAIGVLREEAPDDA